jgi:hypothetical protein
MTQETEQITVDIEVEDATLGELIVWRGCKDKGKCDGYVDFWVHHRRTEILAGQAQAFIGDLIMKGRVDAKGRATISFEPACWSQLIEWQRHMQVLGNIYLRSFELIGVEPAADDEHGRASFRAAMAQRQLRLAQDGGQRTIGLVQS